MMPDIDHDEEFSELQCAFEDPRLVAAVDRAAAMSRAWDGISPDHDIPFLLEDEV